MKKTLLLIIVCCITLLFVFSCSNKISPEHKEIPLGVNDSTRQKAHEGKVERPEQTLVELGLDEYFANNLTYKQAIAYQKADKITVISGRSNGSDGPSTWITECSNNSGEFVLSADVEWKTMPNLGTDILGISACFDKALDAVDNYQMWISYNGQKIILDLDKDYSVLSDGYQHTIAAKYDLHKLLKNVELNEDSSLRIHFEIHGMRRNFTIGCQYNVQLSYDHGETPFDNKTEIGIKNVGFQFMINKYSEMKATLYTLRSYTLLEYMPE